MGSKKSKQAANSICVNRKALYDFSLGEQFEAGMVLEGWEVKSIRSGRAQLKESYVVIKQGEAWLLGAHISPLPSASTHINPDPIRSRKLLLNTRELSKLIGAVQRAGMTLVALSMYWKGPRVKLKIALAKGKKQHDKRQALKDKAIARH